MAYRSRQHLETSDIHVEIFALLRVLVVEVVELSLS
jgi:hypothetical protein